MFKEISVFSEKLNIRLTTGKIARQAGGAVVVESGDTVVIATACTARSPKEGLDFFPLTVEYREKMYAAGKIPGGFFKREARPSTKETLVSRLIDRPIRPLFPDKFRNETQIIAQAVAYDGEVQPEILALIGSSAALAISESPFMGPVGGVRVGMVDGKFVANPTASQMAQSQLDLVVAGTAKAITMVESQASGLNEEVYIQALAFAHEQVQAVVGLIQELQAKVSKPKLAYVAPEIDKSLMGELVELYFKPFRASLDLNTKQERENKSADLKTEILAKMATRIQETPGLAGKIKEYLHDIEYDVIRKMIVQEKLRIDKRGTHQLRPVTCEVDVFKRLHGSSLFTRGETQALAAMTLGGGDDEQFIDGLDETYKERFLLHYNFPPFSVGECGRFGAPGRREIGHGELATKALRAVLPTVEEFPYTIRMVSEIMESNGSSSMATVCSSSLAMMAGGVPLKASVAGVAMGLFMLGDDYTVLTDIQGAEDHYGDMDFKVAGTSEGITALQMDIKIEGVSLEIMKVALAQAKTNRLELLSIMNATLNTPREGISEFAPRILIIEIPKEKIGEVIGPGGKVIRRMTEAWGVKIEVTEADGRGIVKVLSVDGPSGENAMNEIRSIVEEPEIGTIYDALVRRVEAYGAFCEILPGREGLVHVSKISRKTRLKSAGEILNEGDRILVKLLEIDKQGRLNLSAIDVPENDF